jgi:hypothetical protein
MATIDFLVTQNDDWYTKYVLPWLATSEQHVKWNTWRFNKTSTCAPHVTSVAAYPLGRR